MKQVKDKKYKCKVCKALYTKTKPFQTWCSIECGTLLAKKKLQNKIAQEKLEAKREWKARKEQIRVELTGGSDKLQIAVNHIARLLDKDKPCIARPTEAAREWHGGHVFSTASHPAIRYNLWNIHKQSHKSNSIMGGEQELMFDGIEERYGQETLNMVKALPGKYPTMQFKAWELAEALKKANQIIRELKAGVEMDRDKVNERIGLYLKI